MPTAPCGAHEALAEERVAAGERPQHDVLNVRQPYPLTSPRSRHQGPRSTDENKAPSPDHTCST